MLTSSTKQSGVSLLESMIALLVISIGLLGIAGLQIHAMKQNSSAYWHSQAVLAAHNMSDRIRANRIVIASYVGVDTVSVTDQDCIVSACNTADMINADATDWKALVSILPSGRGLIRSPAGIANQLDVVVMWDDAGTGATGEDCSNNPEVDLSCYTITMSIL